MKNFTAIVVFYFATFGLTSPTLAAVNSFMKIDDIVGESMDPEHYGDIEILSWQMDATARPTSTSPGSLSFTKYVDVASTNFLQNCCNGKRYSNATLTVRTDDANSLGNLIIEMTDVIIANYTLKNSLNRSFGTGSDSDPMPTEEITLGYSSITITYIRPESDGAMQGEIIKYSRDISN